MNSTPAPNLDIDRVLRETFIAAAEHHPTLGSSNDRAAQCATDGRASLPLVVVADQQTAGRGRGGNRWWTGAGSLAFSLLLAPGQLGTTSRSRSPLVALAAGLAVVEAVAPLAPGRSIGIHWPNDVMADGRKLAGILIEVMPTGHHVIGVGLNLNNTAADAPAELSPLVCTLRDLTGALHDRTTVLIALLQRLEGKLGELISTPERVTAQADALCLQRNKELTIAQAGQKMTGRCAGIALDGALLLDAPQGRCAIYSGLVRGQN